ncbi:MAG: DNRLRE domain-containing protein [Bacteroidia bacterium]
MKKINLKRCLILIACCISNTLFAQTTITLQPDAVNGIDAKINSHPSYVNINYETHEASEFGAATDGGTPYLVRDLLQFDLSSIPSGQNIISAYLTMYCRVGASNLTGSGGHYNYTDNSGYIDKITSPWSESTVTWNMQPTITTTGRIALPVTGNDTASLNVDITSFIQQWVTNPSSNYGMMFRVANETPYRNRKYYSSDATNPAVRPKLVVTYGPCSTPSASITALGPLTFCAGDDVLLTEAITPGAAYQWKKGATIISGATASSYSATTSGTFKCIVTNGCGLSATSNSITSTKVVLAVPTISAAGPTTFCVGGNVTLNASNPGAGYTFQWYRNNISKTGATALSYVATNSGSYRILIYNTSTGCSRMSGTIQVTATNCRSIDDSQVISVAQSGNESVLAFPNPTNGSFQFELLDSPNASGDAEVILLNTLGQQIFKSIEQVENGQLDNQIDLQNNLQKGVYILHVTFNNKLYQGKIVLD